MEPPYVQQGQATFTVDRSALLLLAFATVIVFAGLFVLLSALPPEATLARATPDTACGDARRCRGRHVMGRLWNLYRRMPKRVLPSGPVESRLTVVAPAMVRIGPGATTMLMTEWPASRPGSATSAETSTGPN
jgi:hypothetical protein